ncbi:hypothetical protein DEO72_LG6g942 [Vigna unguiculata]|uniref:Uncharacterized protein n=1 Tax=Vigna unguiculata TaxID=3917 RepID=A0A4D6M6E6_VIGUN|nr:hypothetical protein DEO72_LG6g942 [Vigna unguiculata]
MENKSVVETSIDANRMGTTIEWALMKKQACDIVAAYCVLRGLSAQSKRPCDIGVTYCVLKGLSTQSKQACDIVAAYCVLRGLSTQTYYVLRGLSTQSKRPCDIGVAYCVLRGLSAQSKQHYFVCSYLVRDVVGTVINQDVHLSNEEQIRQCIPDYPIRYSVIHYQIDLSGIGSRIR